ncbi:MAG: hypothetical protein HZB65_01220 [Candidatus Aenigmarchaeota archaeon]|nr:hypothetical protein [Candidatus Aenigmarchaeota archaeon]
MKKITGNKEPRILCKFDKREDLAPILRKKGLFILPTTNGEYVLVIGDGFHDLEDITKIPIINYDPKLPFKLKSAGHGDSEGQKLEYTISTKLIETFVNRGTLITTIRGRKYSTPFHFMFNGNKIETNSVQIEADSGLEGEKEIVIIEAKSSKPTNFVIRQLYYPYRFWNMTTGKEVIPIFFIYDKFNDTYCFWEYEFQDKMNYNSIRLVKMGRYKIIQ